jgi:uncharacterized protein (TIGR00730 family)
MAPPPPLRALTDTFGERATSEPRLLEGRDSRLEELARVVRISREFVHGFRALHFLGPCVTFFGSARLGPDTPEYAAARRLAGAVARTGYHVMTGGGPGLMEAASRGAKEAGGYTVGATIDIGREAVNDYLDRVVRFHYFFARKVILVKYSYGFVLLPGGYGTLDELFEALTLMQTGRLHDFPVVLYGADYWRGLLDWITGTLAGRGTIGPLDVDRLIVTDDPDQVVEVLVGAARRWGVRGIRDPQAPSR